MLPVLDLTPAQRQRHTFARSANRVARSIATSVSCSVGKSNEIGQTTLSLMLKCIVTNFSKTLCGGRNLEITNGKCYVVEAGIQYFPSGRNNFVQHLCQSSCFQVCFQWKWYSGVAFSSNHFQGYDHFHQISRNSALGMSATYTINTISGTVPSSHTA